MQKLEEIIEKIDELEAEYTKADHRILFGAGALAMGESVKEIIQKHMDELRSTYDGWIPVEKRLPEETRTYIVAALSGMKNAITLAIWKNESKRFYITGERENYKVVAWRHLPEPYWPGGRAANKQESIESKRMREREEFFRDI